MCGESNSILVLSVSYNDKPDKKQKKISGKRSASCFIHLKSRGKWGKRKIHSGIIFEIKGDEIESGSRGAGMPPKTFPFKV